MKGLMVPFHQIHDEGAFAAPTAPKNTYPLRVFKKSITRPQFQNVIFMLCCHILHQDQKSDDSLLRNLKTDCPLFSPEPCIYQYWKFVTTCFSASTTKVESTAPAMYILTALGSASLNLN